VAGIRAAAPPAAAGGGPGPPWRHRHHGRGLARRQAAVGGAAGPRPVRQCGARGGAGRGGQFAGLARK